MIQKSNLYEVNGNINVQTKLILHDIDFHPGHNDRHWAVDCVVSVKKRFTSNTHPPIHQILCITDKGIISLTSCKSSPISSFSLNLVIKADWLKSLDDVCCSRVRSLQPLVTATQFRIDDLEVKLSPLSSELLQLVQS